MDPKIFILIGIVVIIVFFIFKNKFNKKEIKQSNKTIFKHPNSEIDELTFLNNDYEKEKLKELKYLTAQQESSDDDINSKDLF